MTSTIDIRYLEAEETRIQHHTDAQTQAAIEALGAHLLEHEADFGTMTPVDLQRANEAIFNTQRVDRLIREELETDLSEHLVSAATMLTDWAAIVLEAGTYASRACRLTEIRALAPETAVDLVTDCLVQTTRTSRPEKFAGVASQLGGVITRHVPAIDDRREAIMTAAEILAMLLPLGLYTIDRSLNERTEEVGFMLTSCVSLSERLQRWIDAALFVPPMVCEPEIVTGNRQTGYLGVTGSVHLGRETQHDGCASLDVLNTQNQVALRLDVELLKQVEHRPNKPFTDMKAQQNWSRFAHETKALAVYLATQTRHDNHRIWLTHAWDSRGRIYSRGYHVHTQGSAYHKAMLELAGEEIVEGVPQSI